VPDGQNELQALATPILAALALGSLLASGAIQLLVERRLVRRIVQQPLVRVFVEQSGGGADAWRDLATLAAASSTAELLSRDPARLGASLRDAAALAYATPSRYEALVRLLSHGGGKDDLEIVLGHELNQAGLRPTTEDQFRAELRFRESRDRLRTRAIRRLEGLETEMDGARGFLSTATALAVAPWPAVLLIGAGSLPATILTVGAALASAILALRIAMRARVGGSDRRA
jgi:hypothetical protein